MDGVLILVPVVGRLPQGCDYMICPDPTDALYIVRLMSDHVKNTPPLRVGLINEIFSKRNLSG
jgi:hypothetical protein